MIDREKVVKGLERCSKHDGSECPQCPYFNGECTDDLMADALATLKEQQEIVRCKDCKHAVPDDAFFVCEHPFGLTGMKHTADWFCADGKRRTDDA